MPELPDITVYCETVEAKLKGHTLSNIRFFNPFFLRSVEPTPQALFGKRVEGTHRLGKRVVIEFEDGLFAVIHLMIAGRLQFKPTDAKTGSKRKLAMLDFDNGSIMVTEAGTKKRASFHVCSNETLSDHDPGGIEPLNVSESEFSKALTHRNHTLKRVLTDPGIFSGIGNAYSDEILHKAKLSPILQSQKMNDEQIGALFKAVQSTLVEWTKHLRDEAGGEIPEKVTAFRPEMAVHGKYGEPCPVCE
ncbi:MAG: DNA-formamidopyrimidine glycosylase family protein, partial [Pseudomonadota bacterium]